MDKTRTDVAVGQLQQHENRRFNRIETSFGNYYGRNFGSRGLGGQIYSGLIKCKLAHGTGRSVFVPDLLFLGKDGARWIQPLAFSPPMLSKIAEDSIECRFSVDVSCGQRLEVRFKSHDFVAVFEDGSELYKCSLLGPPSLHSYATGEAELRRGKGPLITLYHHTTQDSKNRILEGGAFRLSHWNIQGTDKTVKNVGYVYFTALDRITCDEDLKCIAMSSDAVIYLVIDGFSPPNLLSAEILERHSQSILPLKVYRGSTSDRQATLAFQVDATTLAPQHLLLHTGDLPMWYEICNPFTHRIGVVPDNQLCFRGSVIERGSFPSKTFAYLVVGDASSVVGLAAPYDEETTEAIFKIEPPRPAAPLLNVWFDDGNTDLYSTKRPELQSFDQHR